MMQNDPNDDLPCKLQVGFLFKRICGRMSRVGCEYCKGQAVAVGTDMWSRGNDPYFMDHDMYRGYGNYRTQGYFGYDYVDSDQAAFINDSDRDYQTDAAS